MSEAQAHCLRLHVARSCRHEKGMLMPLLATKLSIPQIRRRLVQRSGLTKQLNEGLRHELPLVSAPAGFDKTMLVSE